MHCRWLFHVKFEKDESRLGCSEAVVDFYNLSKLKNYVKEVSNL